MINQNPPKAEDLETMVLGAILLEKEAAITVFGILNSDSFYGRPHQDIFGAMAEMYSDNQPIDIVTVTQKLLSKKILKSVGGPAYISELASRVASTANVEFHARIVKQKQIARELISLCHRTASSCYGQETDVFELIDNHSRDFTKLSTINTTKSDTNIEEQTIVLIDKNRQISESGEPSGVLSGIRGLDATLNGLQAGELHILAARPSMGKTALSLQIARNAIINEQHIAFVSLEMSALQLTKRLLAQESGINTKKLGQQVFSQLEDVVRLSSGIINTRFHIVEDSDLGPNELKNKLRQLKRDHDIKLIVLDYLQLLSGGSNKGNREGVISEFSRATKTIAKELDVPAVVLSQLNRSVESRGGMKIPMLSDLRESGAIEQDADVVAFLWRPKYYDIDTNSEGDHVSHDYAEIIIAKNRNGALGKVATSFHESTTRFYDYGETPEPESTTAMSANENFNNGEEDF